MDNQHRKIDGYRELNENEIDCMNAIKDIANKVGNLIINLERDMTTDGRWVAIGKNDLQKGFMALVRSVAKPNSF